MATNKRRNREDDEDILIGLILEYPFLQRNIKAALFLRDPNNMLPVTQQLIDIIDTNPIEVLKDIDNFFKSTTSTFFGDDLFIETNFYGNPIIDMLDIKFKLKQNILELENSRGRILHVVEDKAEELVFERYHMYFNELNNFFVRFNDELIENGSLKFRCFSGFINVRREDNIGPSFNFSINEENIEDNIENNMRENSEMVN